MNRVWQAVSESIIKPVVEIVGFVQQNSGANQSSPTGKYTATNTCSHDLS